jgi:hypothetical protein
MMKTFFLTFVLSGNHMTYDMRTNSIGSTVCASFLCTTSAALGGGGGVPFRKCAVRIPAWLSSVPSGGITHKIRP